MPALNHPHKLKRHKYKNGTTIYFCTLDCTYKGDPALMVGKSSACNRCGNTFILTPYALTLKEPHCNQCVKSSRIVITAPKPNLDEMIKDEVVKDETKDELPTNNFSSLKERLNPRIHYETIMANLSETDDDLL